jgi:lipopolysaccharide/colanic/teichoic acid biosynthesis glycosyltransferase
VISDPLKLKELIEKEKINTIVLAPFGFNEEVVKWLLKDEKPNLNIISFSDLYEEITKKVPLSSVNKLWVIENFKEKKLEMILKRILDVILSLIGLLITLIIFPLVALLIKIDLKDSIFYKQKRKGKDGKIFTIYKFRTVKENNEKEKDIFKAVKKDLSLLSPISRFLRRWEIDEFPQFFNILKGELSFVGPRPEWIELSNVYEKEIPNFSYRYLIKPGLTGWAQIHYPPSTSLSEGEEKLAYDLYYIKNYSFFLDIYILFKTFYLLLFKSFENLN